jgi:hypothetical protein
MLGLPTRLSKMHRMHSFPDRDIISGTKTGVDVHIEITLHGNQVRMTESGHIVGRF